MAIINVIIAMFHSKLKWLQLPYSDDCRSW